MQAKERERERGIRAKQNKNEYLKSGRCDDGDCGCEGQTVPLLESKKQKKDEILKKAIKSSRDSKE
jgi:hypothetical protein